VMGHVQMKLSALRPDNAEHRRVAIVLEGRIVPPDGKSSPVSHAFHVEVRDPGGRERRELSRNILARNGRFRERFFAGHNAAAGRWTIRVRDVASGTVRSASAELSGGPGSLGAKDR